MLLNHAFTALATLTFAFSVAAQVPAPMTPSEPSKVMKIVLPTDNDALLKGDFQSFFMFVDRNFENQVTTPWEGGQYGYVRGPLRLGSQVVLMHFHEGIDIAPVKRDAKGEPIDEVRSISDGEVVYVLQAPGGSNYGRYVVIKHDWGQGPVFSLYAHLSKITAQVGQKVVPGTPIGIMGHTGSGLDRRRSHVHLEINLFVSSRFSEWHEKYFKPSPNPHGVYNGLNLTGLDVTGFYLTLQKNPTLTVAEFVKSIEPTWKAIVPRKGELELLKNYPWLSSETGEAGASPSWQISFSDSGLPISVEPSKQVVTAPVVVWVKNRGMPHSYYTRGHVGGSGDVGTLTGSGARYLELILGDFPTPAPVVPVKLAPKK